RNTDLTAYANQDLPFNHLVETLNPHRTTTHHPLFQVMLAHRTTTPDTPHFHNLHTHIDTIHPGTAKFDLTFDFLEQHTPNGQPNGTHAHIEYSTDLFERSTVEALGARLVRLLEAVVADPDRPIGSLEILSAEERELVLHQWNDTARALPGSTLPELFSERVNTDPDAPALEHPGGVLTARELDERANRLAHHLIQAGIAPEDLIALALPRSADLVIGALAAWKAGAAYIPVDPDYPTDRIAYILEDSRPRLTLTTTQHTDRLPAGHATVLLDQLDLSNTPTNTPRSALRPQNPAYVIYTSGSTGRPKGVTVTHTGVLSLTTTHQERFGLGPGSRVLQFASPSFDAAFWELTMGLLSGGTLVIADRDHLMPGEPLATTLAALRITHAMLPPVALAATEPSPLTHGTTLISGGEALTATQVERWSPKHSLFNAYGPTESTVAVTFSQNLTEPQTPPIGTPITNTRIYILDEHLNPVPPNTPGELYTTGPGLARGYLGRPALTAERFTANPYGQPGTRLYRTGDLARWTTDGQLHHLGRADDQIKIRGFRIELGEIETTLTRHPHITQATVIVREDQPGNPQLTAYAQPHPGTNPTSAELRHHTQQALPHYMVPAHIVILDELPLTPNGKINRKALPAPVHTTQATTLPRTPHEEIIAGIITDLLQLPTINTTDNFFDLGGHSLLATRLITRINTTLTTNLTIRDLFDNPTTTQLAHLVQTGGAKDPFDVLLPLRTTGDKPPLFCIHPGLGFGWPYSALLSSIGKDRPLYAIQARSLGSPGLRPASVEDMARDYVEQMRTVQPSGPYHVLGWSFGGLVVHTVAVELQQQGEEVEFVGILDTYPGEEYEFGTVEVTENEALALLLEDFGLRVAEADLPSLDRDRFAEIMHGQVEAVQFLRLDQVRNLVDTWVHNVDLLRRFRPGTFKGDALLFTATTGRTEASPSRDSWDRYVDGVVRKVDVACTHGEMMRPGPAAEIGRVISAALDSRSE
ncbi:amino acid adenylation domain-containing protein, partial [Kitasatospora sp. NPDC094011]|uniref:non-ribosomal peptide synthetase n=1 Tax=Kitasatospora sp. NPDC094011 TaxID=3364090 RepID=UPI0038047264